MSVFTWESSLNRASDSAVYAFSATVRPSAAPDPQRRTAWGSFTPWLEQGGKRWGSRELGSLG